jgi:hypothetical protein
MMDELIRDDTPNNIHGQYVRICNFVYGIHWKLIDKEMIRLIRESK